LGAAAAYCAVLVVFISNVGQNGPSWFDLIAGVFVGKSLGSVNPEKG
jgi:hypothetical protein